MEQNATGTAAIYCHTGFMTWHISGVFCGTNNIVAKRDVQTKIHFSLRSSANKNHIQVLCVRKTVRIRYLIGEVAISYHLEYVD